MNKWLRSTECIAFEEEGGVAVITLNRPEKRNALSRQLLTELRQAMMEADDRKSVRCIVLRGAGADFCAGYDLVKNYNMTGAPASDSYDESLYRSPLGSYDDDVWRLERNQADIITIFDIHKPVIAQVQGNCLAGGTDVALMCDMVIAADDAAIGFPATRGQGSPPCHLWTYLVGPQWAKRLLLTGDLISGRDAQQIGLVLQSVPADKLADHVMALARRVALVDADVLACNKRIVNLSLEMMGARSLQRLGAENDARGHQAASARAFVQRFSESGLRAAVRERDEPFGDSHVRLDG
jgi:enoyl-CoA hydratase